MRYYLVDYRLRLVRAFITFVNFSCSISLSILLFIC